MLERILRRHVSRVRVGVRRLLALTALACLAFAAAATAGSSSPTSATKAAPTLPAIHAVFDPAAYATYYSVNDVTIPSGTTKTAGPVYTWHQDVPPDDPSCNNFHTLSDGRAVWYHADVKIRPPDGCHHLTIEHNGIVTMTVTLTLKSDPRPWTCVATYFGTLSGDGEPGLCTITAPAIHPVKRPKTPWKVKWRNAGEFSEEYGNGVAAGGTAIGISPLLKPAAAAWGLAGVGFKVVGKWMIHKAQDPADPHFATLASPPAQRPVRIEASPAISIYLAYAANAWSDNVAVTASLSSAFVTSINRAQGAFDAHNAAAEQNQEEAAARLALQIAALDDARPALRAQFRATLLAANIHASVTAAQLRSSVKKGLPASFVAALRSIGVSASDIADLRKGVAHARIPAAGIDLAASLADPKLTAIDKQDALLMRAYARLVQG